MGSITTYLTNDHKRCDEIFIEAENCASKELWGNAENCFLQFREALEQHFAMEEKVLFLAFEKAIGHSDGPTAMMRNEHRQILGIISMLQDALTQHDTNGFLGHAETLNIMLQQHNLKEESILYLMTDRMLSEQRDDIIEAMSQVGVII